MSDDKKTKVVLKFEDKVIRTFGDIESIDISADGMLVSGGNGIAGQYTNPTHPLVLTPTHPLTLKGTAVSQVREPDVLTITLSGNRHFVTIKADGTTILGEGFRDDPDNAAKNFWETMGKFHSDEIAEIKRDNERLMKQTLNGTPQLIERIIELENEVTRLKQRERYLMQLAGMEIK